MTLTHFVNGTSSQKAQRSELNPCTSLYTFSFRYFYRDDEMQKKVTLPEIFHLYDLKHRIEVCTFTSIADIRIPLYTIVSRDEMLDILHQQHYVDAIEGDKHSTEVMAFLFDITSGIVTNSQYYPNAWNVRCNASSNWEIYNMVNGQIWACEYSHNTACSLARLLNTDDESIVYDTSYDVPLGLRFMYMPFQFVENFSSCDTVASCIGCLGLVQYCICPFTPDVQNEYCIPAVYAPTKALWEHGFAAYLEAQDIQEAMEIATLKTARLNVCNASCITCRVDFWSCSCDPFQFNGTDYCIEDYSTFEVEDCCGGCDHTVSCCICNREEGDY